MLLSCWFCQFIKIRGRFSVSQSNIFMGDVALARLIYSMY